MALSRRTAAEITSQSAFAQNTRVGPTAVRPVTLARGTGPETKFSGEPRRSGFARVIAGIQTGGATVVRKAFTEYQNQGEGQMPGSYLDPSSGGLPGGGGSGGFSLCPPGVPQYLCDVGGRIIDDYLAPPRQQTPTCEPGFILNPNNGVCEFVGSPGDASTPSGASLGVFGAPAVPSIVVGEITRQNGQQTLIRRCPHGGLVLGRDNLCYAKGSIPNKLRKWPKQAKAPVTAYDAKMMRKYGPGGSKQSSIKKLAGNAGLSCKRK